jgi:hypothetical protein
VHHHSLVRPAARLAVALVGALLAGAVVPVGATAATPVPRPPVAFSGAPEPFAKYVGQRSCDPTEKPGAAAIRALLKTTYGVANSAGTTRSCSTGGTSEHKEGRAYDWMQDVGDPAEKARADAFVAWATGPDAAGVPGGNARRLGIMYLIWNKRSWSSYAGGTWKAYTGASPHTDHVHISLTWDGAYKRTSWWTGRTVADHDFGPCAVYQGEPAPKHPATARNTSPCPPAVPRVEGVVSGDWDGDGDSELGTFRNGLFALSVGGRTREVRFGTRGDVPVVGDWDGDGLDEIGVFRRGTWFLRDDLSTGAADRVFAYGGARDVPVTGVWDAGHQGIGVRRGNQWYLRSGVSAGRTHISTAFGRADDRPLVGDWDADGVDALGVRRGAQWYLTRGTRDLATVAVFGFGKGTFVPVAGDWDGDGQDSGLTVHLGSSYWRDDLNGGVATGTGSVPF